MIRGVVHKPLPGGGATESGDADSSQQDKFADKLVKYIPAEAIAFYTPMYAYVHSNVSKDVPAKGDVPAHIVITDENPLIYVLVVTTLGALGYLWIRRTKEKDPATGKPAKVTKAYFYVLSLLAFLAWAIGTSTVGQDLLGIPGWWDKVVLLTGVFMIPMVDELLSGGSG